MSGSISEPDVPHIMVSQARSAVFCIAGWLPGKSPKNRGHPQGTSVGPVAAGSR